MQIKTVSLCRNPRTQGERSRGAADYPAKQLLAGLLSVWPWALFPEESRDNLSLLGFQNLQGFCFAEPAEHFGSLRFASSPQQWRLSSNPTAPSRVYRLHNSMNHEGGCKHLRTAGSSQPGLIKAIQPGRFKRICAATSGKGKHPWPSTRRRHLDTNHINQVLEVAQDSKYDFRSISLPEHGSCKQVLQQSEFPFPTGSARKRLGRTP